MGTAENPHAGQGMVVLDIGGAIGALIVSAPASMEGVEIEIAPAGRRDGEPDEGRGWWQGEWHSHSHAAGHHHSHEPAWPHVAVVGRPQNGDTAYAAVYPGLGEGDYELWPIGAKYPVLSAKVVGGSVTEVVWPD